MRNHFILLEFFLNVFSGFSVSLSETNTPFEISSIKVNIATIDIHIAVLIIFNSKLIHHDNSFPFNFYDVAGLISLLPDM
jgi:hypothetical protein